MAGQHVDFFQMGCQRIECLDVGETHRRLGCDSDPQVAKPTGGVQFGMARCFIEHRLRGMSPQQLRRGTFDEWYL
jgi:hypothetical protein